MKGDNYVTFFQQGEVIVKEEPEEHEEMEEEEEDEVF